MQKTLIKSAWKLNYVVCKWWK